MGQEIEASKFTKADFEAFEERLRAETDLLARWFADDVFASTPKVGGFELESWLVGPDMRPAPVVEPFLDRLEDPLVVPELATFNAEINGTPQPLNGQALSRLADELESTWARCTAAAAALGARLAMIGILPTVRPEHLDLEHMTPRPRYRALNEQILSLRRGRPLTLEIQGRDHLFVEQQDVMLESAATSFQIHLKVSPDEATRVYNCSKILAAPMVAISANSPYLFGCDLWDESRIPLFEQAVSVGGSIFSERVTFGLRYLDASVLECFTRQSQALSRAAATGDGRTARATGASAPAQRHHLALEPTSHRLRGIRDAPSAHRAPRGAGWSHRRRRHRERGTLFRRRAFPVTGCHAARAAASLPGREGELLCRRARGPECGDRMARRSPCPIDGGAPQRPAATRPPGFDGHGCGCGRGRSLARDHLRPAGVGADRVRPGSAPSSPATATTCRR